MFRLHFPARSSVTSCLARIESTESLLKSAFEERNLQYYINQHRINSDCDENYVSDITTGAKYRSFEQDSFQGQSNICLLWNTDGLPIANNSNAQVWLLQAQIINIPPEKRRTFQFVCGVYYSREKKPNVTYFLKPFVNSLINLYQNGFEWYDKKDNVTCRSTVIAPIATLDAPARAPVQNLMQFNGEYGCTYCEHPGEIGKTGSGFNRVYPVANEDIEKRTKDRMFSQALEVIMTEVEHCKGVKGPSITALLPKFDPADSFVPDYMHAILLGVFRMLIKLWFSTKYKDKPFYIKKSFRDSINESLSKIFPPDYIPRTPRILKYIHFLKASELKEKLLHYFPILLKDKLPTIYYEHFLLFAYGTTTLLKPKISEQEIKLAEYLYNLFIIKFEKMYGRNKMSFNLHQLKHIIHHVRLWGPLWSWSAFDFEDGNGYVKKIVHGSNKLEMEIAYSMYLFNAHTILKNKLEIVSDKNSDIDKIVPLGKVLQNIIYKTNESESIKSFYLVNQVPVESIKIIRKVRMGKTIVTSQLYSRQKKRSNCTIYWNDQFFGTAVFFILFNNKLYALIKRLELSQNQDDKIIVKDIALDFSTYIFPVFPFMKQKIFL